MLQAKSKNGQLVTLLHRTKQEIQIARQNEFFCPVCNESVLVKAGDKTVPHFAHRVAKECSSNDYGEGPYHENGKTELYKWFTFQGCQVELEKYIPVINQRPDLFITFHTKKIAIEYQCARIPIEVINQRNQGYIKAGITPIWILGATHFQRLRQYHFKTDQFILSFLHRFSTDFPLTLYFFCPLTLQFIIVQHLHQATPRQAIGLFTFSSLKEMIFSSMFLRKEFDETWLYELWRKEKLSFRLRQSPRNYGSELEWLKWLYEKGTHKEKLPSIVHLPVSSQHLMKTPLHNWQSRLCLDLLMPLQIGSKFLLRDCERLLRYRPKQSLLLKGTGHPIYNYLLILNRLGFIDQCETGSFVKKKEIIFHKNIEDSLKADARLMNQLIHYSTIGK